MAPVKFDDFSKTATQILNDDFQSSGFVLKAKQKTGWGNSVLSTHIDLFDAKCATPAKLTWKLPKPFGCEHFVIDKLEMDKGGKFKFEASSDKCHPAVKVDLKHDFTTNDKVSAGLTYNGIDNLQLKYETKVMNPQEFNGEVTYVHNMVTGGVKFNDCVCRGGLPDIGLRVSSGPLFCALMSKDSLKTFNFSSAYTLNDDVKCAAAASYGLKVGAVQNGVVGVVYKNSYKVKAAQDQSVHVSVKHDLAKGFALLGGLKYSGAKGLSYGLQLSVE